MKISNMFIMMLCIFMTGCVSQLQVLKSESEAREKSESEAREFMDRAAAFENSEAYLQALKEYAEVAGRYPSTSYYKRAVWKTALLNIHPDNPEINEAAAHDWLQVYLGLPLSPEEKEAATAFVSMLEKTNNLKIELSDIITQKDKLAAVSQKQADDMEAGAQRVKELETELANAWDELQKMKAVDVRMHRGRVDKNSGKPSPLLQEVSDPKNDTGQKRLPSLGSAPEKDQEFYPYAVQVGSHRDEKDAMREAMILRDKGDSVCISYAQIAGKGDWHRVLVGFYRTPEEAKNAASELKIREYRNAFVVRWPFTVEIGVFSGDEKLKSIKAKLISNGYSAYTLPNKVAENTFRLLVGAFHTEKEAATVTQNLQNEGFEPKVVRR